MICPGRNDGGGRSATSGRTARAYTPPELPAEIVRGSVVRQALLGGQCQVLFGERPVVLEALVQRQQMDVKLETARPHSPNDGLE